MNKIETAYQELSTLLEKHTACKDNIYAQYSFLVNGILTEQIVSEKEIDAIIDGLLDFCYEERFLILHAQLCQHVFEHYPNLTGSLKNIYRLQFSGIVGETRNEDR